MDQALLEMLVCPACQGDLQEQEGCPVCRACGLTYPVKDGVPILVVRDAKRSTA